MAGGLDFCTIQATARPFSLVAGGSTVTRLTLVAPAIVTWNDGALDTWGPDGFSVTSAYDATILTIDTTAWVWLVVAVKGVANSARLVKEADYANMGDTVLAGLTCQALYRIVGVDYSLFQEAAPGTAGDGVPFPAGTAIGDIPYWDGTAWVLRHIGNQGDLLFVDAGVPVWRSLTDGTGVIPPDAPSTGLVTNLNSKVFSLWTGSGNGAPPSNWPGLSFDDSSWATAVAQPLDNVHPTPSGATWISYTDANVPPLSEWLARINFTLSGGLVHSLTIQYNVDDYLLGVWLNGIQVASADATASYAIRTVAIPVSALVIGGQNVLGMGVQNSTTNTNPTGLVALLSIN